jgi:hypothetical protein
MRFQSEGGISPWINPTRNPGAFGGPAHTEGSGRVMRWIAEVLAIKDAPGFARTRGGAGEAQARFAAVHRRRGQREESDFRQARAPLPIAAEIGARLATHRERGDRVDLIAIGHAGV